MNSPQIAEAAIDLYVENIECHGHDPERAKAGALREIVDAEDATAELDAADGSHRQIVDQQAEHTTEVYFDRQTGSHGWRCSCGEGSRPALPPHAAEWAAESHAKRRAPEIDPGQQHQFHFSVTVQGEGCNWTSEPFQLTVRANSLTEACTKAAAVRLPDWTHPDEDLGDVDLVASSDHVAAALPSHEGERGILRCAKCSSTQDLGDTGHRLANGWPKCCGLTMTWWTQRQIDAGEMPRWPAP
jgi:hypothetical protein